MDESYSWFFIIALVNFYVTFFVVVARDELRIRKEGR